MKKKTLFIAMMLGFLFSSIACSSSDEPKYTRADCIVEVQLAWNVGGVEQIKLLNLLADAIDNAESLGYKGPHPAGFTFQQGDTRLYLQYYSDCNRRVSSTEGLLTSVADSILSGKASYQVNKTRIYPDVKTIMLEGAAWID